MLARFRCSAALADNASWRAAAFCVMCSPQRKARVAAQSIRINSRRGLADESERRITADSSRPWVMLKKYDKEMTG
ncbi:hypothetical protein PPUJ20005_29120 [Pseudomonas putida]|nr:hypothetical protein PPUJ20005_29120 [Pseudomonas putida]GLO25199.1 hypothetical protein PPUJ21368_30280 [Pseudomonas putida]